MIFGIVFLLLRYYLPLETGGVLHLNKLESFSPKDDLCQLCKPRSSFIYMKYYKRLMKEYIVVLPNIFYDQFFDWQAMIISLTKIIITYLRSLAVSGCETVFGINAVFSSFKLAALQRFTITIIRRLPVLRSAKRAPANVRQLNNISDVVFYCSVGERSRALALLNAALNNLHFSP